MGKASVPGINIRSIYMSGLLEVVVGVMAEIEGTV